jgi:hypothetical protein
VGGVPDRFRRAEPIASCALEQDATVTEEEALPRPSAAWAVVLVLGGSMLGPLGASGRVLGAQVGVAALALTALFVILRHRSIHVDLAVLLWLGLVGVALWQSHRLGAAGGGVGVFVPLAVAAASVPQFGRGGRHTTEWVIAAMAAVGVILTVWMTVRLVPALLSPDVTFYHVKGAASLPIGGGNFLAALLVVALLMTLELDPAARWRMPVLAVLAMGTALTFSRAGWLSLLIVLVARWWMLRRDSTQPPSTGRRRWAWVGVVVAAAVVLLVATSLTETTGLPRAEQLLHPAAASRITIWRIGLSALDHAGLTGYGLYGFAPIAFAHGAVETHPHNFFLAGFGMFGLVGGLFYAAWWGVGLWRTLRGPDARLLGLPLLALFLHAQLDAWTFHLPFDLTAVLLVGLAVIRSGDRGVVTIRARRSDAVSSHPVEEVDVADRGRGGPR